MREIGKSVEKDAKSALYIGGKSKLNYAWETNRQRIGCRALVGLGTLCCAFAGPNSQGRLLAQIPEQEACGFQASFDLKTPTGRLVVPVGAGSVQLHSRAKQHIRWLLDSPVRTSTGMVYSWLDSKEPGYLYQESSGYLTSLLVYLHYLTGDEDFLREALKTARSLAEKISGTRGCGRDEKVYLFDTAVCLRGLGSVAAAADPAAEPVLKALEKALETLGHTACEMLRVGSAVSGGTNGEPNVHWSRLFGPHLAKAAHLSIPWLRLEDRDDFLRPAVEKWLARLEREKAVDFLPIHPSYHHALCYAAEGFLGMAAVRGEEPPAIVEQIAQALADRQYEHGGIPRIWPDSTGEAVSDATAQAIRLWQCLDADRYSEQIDAGFEFLDRLSGPDGGLRYSTEIGHLNSWATMFAVQAYLWRDIHPDPRWIV
jgi:hypothetical protein